MVEREDYPEFNKEDEELQVDSNDVDESLAFLSGRKVEQRSTLSFKMVKNIFSKQKKLALIIDAPNILRRINNHQIRLEDIEKIANNLGQIKIAKVILNRHAPKNLLKAMENSGYEPIVATTDIYIRMAIEIMDCVINKNADMIIIASRHARCAPILRAVKANGLDAAIIGFQPGFSIAVKNAADLAFQLEI